MEAMPIDSMQKLRGGLLMKSNQKEWESVSKKGLMKPGGTSIVKAAGCMGCWASKSIAMTRVCALPHPAMKAI